MPLNAPTKAVAADDHGRAIANPKSMDCKTHPNSGLSFYGLLFIEDFEKHTNLIGVTDTILVYLLCGALLNKSLKHYGHEFKIVTNNREALARRIDSNCIDLNVMEIPFSTVVPSTLNFRSAHRKLDLISACGRGEMGLRPGILDLDMMMMRQLPAHLSSSDSLVGYNIWDQVAPAYGPNRVRDDVAKVSGISAEKLEEWWGGEFLVGPNERFADLSREIEWIYPRYLETADSLHHQGDEIVVTAALHRLSKNSGSQDEQIIVDGGELNAIGRWWSSRTLSRIAPLSKLAKRSILHLPADKEILSELSKSESEMPNLTPLLLKSLRKKTRLRRLLAPLYPLTSYFSTSRKFAPRM